MFIMLPCPTVTDNVGLQALGDLAKKIPQLNQTRNEIKKFSNVETLIESVQNGQVIMSKKIKFDQYLKSQVDLMKIYVGSNTPCQFKYNGFFTPQEIITAAMTIKQQWGFQIVLSRYNVCSIYHGGAIGSLAKIFGQTRNSYLPGYKGTPQLTKNLQIAFKYFNQGYEPLKRLSQVYNYVQQLFQPSTLQKYPEVRKQMFFIYADLIQCNLVYLKLQKYRVLSQYKICKEGAWSVFQRLKQIKLKVQKLSEKYKFIDQLASFINLGIVFYKTYSLYFLLLENQQKKVQEQYGFIKKQFQQMVNQNLVVADEIIKLKDLMEKIPGQDLDNVIFANSLVKIMSQEAQKFKYKYNINLHQNKGQKPLIDQITSTRIGVRNIWDSLAAF